MGWGVTPSFKIGLHLKDKALLEQIRDFFGVGNIYTSGLNAWYEVNTLKGIHVIIAHFDKYPLITQKNSDFVLFKLAVSLINQGYHLTQDGLNNIINIKASMNKGVSDKLKQAFPSLAPVVRPVLKDIGLKDPHWVSGFASGEGCFMVRIRNNNNNTSSSKVELIFQITQHIRDQLLLHSLIKYLDCGRFRERKGGLAADLSCINLQIYMKKSYLSLRNTLY